MSIQQWNERSISEEALSSKHKRNAMKVNKFTFTLTHTHKETERERQRHAITVVVIMIIVIIVIIIIIIIVNITTVSEVSLTQFYKVEWEWERKIDRWEERETEKEKERRENQPPPTHSQTHTHTFSLMSYVSHLVNLLLHLLFLLFFFFFFFLSSFVLLLCHCVRVKCVAFPLCPFPSLDAVSNVAASSTCHQDKEVTHTDRDRRRERKRRKRERERERERERKDIVKLWRRRKHKKLCIWVVVTCILRCCRGPPVVYLFLFYRRENSSRGKTCKMKGVVKRILRFIWSYFNLFSLLLSVIFLVILHFLSSVVSSSSCYFFFICFYALNDIFSCLFCLAMVSVCFFSWISYYFSFSFSWSL